jgi:hypothetical protein
MKPNRAYLEMIERIDLGFQCPECYGAQIKLQPRQLHDRYRFQCQECGCEWSRPV